MDKRFDYRIARFQHRFYEMQFKELGINRSEGPYLKMINKYQLIKMNELISKFYFHKSHSTRVIQSLVGSGLVVKEIDPEDKRGYILSITEAGKAKALKIEEVFAMWEKLVDSFINQEEKACLAQLFEKVYQGLEDYFKEEEAGE